MEILHPETGKPLVERVYEGEELYHGPHAHLAPDLTVVLTDWRYRTIGLHDFTTHKVISPAFGPTGDHRMEGILVATGPAFRTGASPVEADLLDIAPTVLHLLEIPVPADMDGRVLTELLGPLAVPVSTASVPIGSPGLFYQSSALPSLRKRWRRRRHVRPLGRSGRFVQRGRGRRDPAAARGPWLSLSGSQTAVDQRPRRDYD